VDPYYNSRFDGVKARGPKKTNFIIDADFNQKQDDEFKYNLFPFLFNLLFDPSICHHHAIM